MQLQKVLSIGLAVMALAGSGIAVVQADEVLVEPGWTTAIMPGGDGGTERLERRAMTRVLSEGGGMLKLRPELSRTRLEFDCRSHVYSRTSGRLGFRSHCLIDRF